MISIRTLIGSIAAALTIGTALGGNVPVEFNVFGVPVTINKTYDQGHHAGTQEGMGKGYYNAVEAGR